MTKNSLAEKIIKTVALPLVLFVIFSCISIATGNSFLSGSMILYTLRQSALVICVAIAIGFHTSSSGFDFAIGAIVYLACIIGGNFAVDHKYGVGVMAAAIIIMAVILSFIEGLMYVVLRLPPVVNSLVYVMICEAFTQILNRGKGFLILTKPQYAWFASMPQIFIVTLLALLAYWIILKYTKFGSDDRALARGQKIAVSFGIKEIKNVLIRYALVGVFLGIAGLIYVGLNYEVDAAKNMSSTILMFNAVLPNMLALTLAKYSNKPIAVTMGVLSMQIISVGFICMKMDANLASVISGTFVLLFIAYFMNLPAREEKKHRAQRAKELNKEFKKVGTERAV